MCDRSEPPEKKEVIYFGLSASQAKPLHRRNIIFSLCPMWFIHLNALHTVTCASVRAHRYMLVCMYVCLRFKIMSIYVSHTKNQSSNQSSVQLVNNFRQNFNLNFEIFGFPSHHAHPMAHLSTIFPILGGSAHILTSTPLPPPVLLAIGSKSMSVLSSI